MVKIYLQSFFSEPKALPYSGARFQPEGYNYPSIEFFKPYLRSGEAIKVKQPRFFLEAYCSTLLRNFKKIEEWLVSIEKDGKDISICCWCSIERNNTYMGKLLCHTVLIGYIIERIAKVRSLDISVIFLDGRDNPVWSREEFSKEMLRLLRG